MASGHSHHHGSGEGAVASRRSIIVLVTLTLSLLLASVIGLFLLWPSGEAEAARSDFLAPGVEIHSVSVTEVPEEAPAEETVTVEAEGRSGPIDGQVIAVEVPPEVAADGIRAGDRLRVLSVEASAEAGEAIDPADQEEAGDPATEADPGAAGSPAADAEQYFYFDHERSLPLGLLFVAYLLIVALVARGAGLRAVVGLAAGVAIVVWFMLPAILAGENAILVALVAGSAIIFPCVYFAHGISVRTTTAVLGTFGGIAVTVLVTLLAGRPAGMTGADGDAAQLLHGTQPQISLSALFLAGVIISGLGALNDVTITQASSAWELRAAMPEASRWRIFTATMRIGRDHIASTVYTLAYAYIGSALPTLVFASTMNRSIGATLTSGEIAAEVFRTLVASIGLVLAIPLTTAIAAALAAGTGSPRRKGRRRARAERLEERLARY